MQPFEEVVDVDLFRVPIALWTADHTTGLERRQLVEKA